MCFVLVEWMLEREENEELTLEYPCYLRHLSSPQDLLTPQLAILIKPSAQTA